MRLRDEYLCTLTDFHIRDGLAVEEPVYQEHLQRCPRCREKIRRHRARVQPRPARRTSGQARSITVSTRPADPKYWALPPRKERRKRQKKWVLVGSTAASLLLLLTGYSHNNQGASNYTNNAQANPIVTEDDLEGLNNAERTILMTAAPGVRATGTLYILKTDNPDEKKLAIAIRGLKPSSNHVYQVWKHSGDRVESLGTVDPSEDGTVMFASRLTDYGSIEGITITKEKRYEKEPMGRDMLVAALSPTWEKNTFLNGRYKTAKKKSESVKPHPIHRCLPDERRQGKPVFLFPRSGYPEKDPQHRHQTILEPGSFPFQSGATKAASDATEKRREPSGQRQPNHFPHQQYEQHHKH